MKLRHKATGTELGGNQFNIHALFEVLAGNDEGADSYSGRELDVFIEARQEWRDLRQAFKDRDVIPNNENTCFGEPQTDADRERGYFL